MLYEIPQARLHIIPLRGNRRREGRYAFTGVFKLSSVLRKKSDDSFKTKNVFVNSVCIFKELTIFSLVFLYLLLTFQLQQ